MRSKYREEIEKKEASSSIIPRRQNRNLDRDKTNVTALLRRKVSESKRKQKHLLHANSNPRLSLDAGISSEDTLESLKPDTQSETVNLRRRWSPNTTSDLYRLDTSMSSFYLSTGHGLSRFRGLVHSIILWIRLFNYHSSQVRKILLFFSNVDLGLFEKPEKEDDLLFSPAAFKANKQAKISTNSIKILRKDPSQRVDEDLRPIMAGLRSYAAIGDFPRDIIERIARRAWFQEFDPASVIVREGDFPMYYYFILSGTVLVSVIDRDKMLAKTVCTLTRGDAFGELAIIDKDRRKSTVIATEKTGLLILEDNDYIDIFMNGGVRFLDDPFLRTVTCFNKFPISCLKKKPRQILFSYFKAGTVLVEDSKMSEWIFIIKSGSCRVMMPVKRLDLVEKEKLEEDREKAGKLTNSRENAGDLSPKESLPEHETLVRRSYRRYMNGLAKMNPFLLSSQSIQVNISSSQEHPQEVLHNIGREDTNLRVQSRMPSLPDITNAGATHGRKISVRFKDEVEAKKPRKVNAHEGSTQIKKQKKQINLSFWSDKETVQGRRTLATDLNKEYFYKNKFYGKRQKEWLLESVAETEEKQLITIQLLTPGMTFGFIDKFFEHQPSLKLVSDGCECFIIRKDVYFENADDELLRAVGFTLRPYPREVDVIERKIEHMEWQKHRRGIMDKTIQTLNTEKVDIHDSKDYWPSYQKLPPII